MTLSKAVVNVMGVVDVYMTNSGDMTVGDVKEWLKAVEDLGIPDDARLTNTTLKLTYRVPHVSQIECGDCAPEKKHVGFTAFETACDREKEN
jgi:hypothetical protein